MLTMNQKINDAQNHLDFLLERTDQFLLQPELLSTVLEELSIAVEELQVQHTEIIATRQELELQRQYYQDLFELAPDSYIVTDLQGLIQECNQATQTLLNLSDNFIKNKPLAVFVKKTERKNFRHKLNKLKAVKQLNNWETSLERKNDQEIPVMISVCTIQNSAQETIGMRWLIRDITKTKEQQLSLEKAKEIAEKGKEMQDTFITNLSYEVRNPLTPILGFSSLLLRNKLTQKQRQYVEHIDTNSRKLLTLFNQILDFSKIKSDRFELQRMPFNLKVLIEEDCLHQFEHLIEEKNLHLSYSIDPQIPKILIGDKIRLYQIISNLLSNAVNFTEKGSIKISVTMIQEDQLSEVNSNLITLKFSIQDTGIGISPEQIESIFEHFTQTQNMILNQYGKIGLGLAIVKILCEKMRGKIWVESTVNQGSTFFFTVKLKKMLNSLRDQC